MKGKEIPVGDWERKFRRWFFTWIATLCVSSAAVAAMVFYLITRQGVENSFYGAHMRLVRLSDILLPATAAAALGGLVTAGVIALIWRDKLVRRVTDGTDAGGEETRSEKRDGVIR